MSFEPVSLDQTDNLLAVLEAREVRAGRQQALLNQHVIPMISFTLNIPGPIKNSAAYRRAHDLGLQALHQTLHQVGV